MSNSRTDPEIPSEDPSDDSQPLALTNPPEPQPIPENKIEVRSPSPRPAQQPGQSFGQTVWRVLVFIFNLLVIIVILSALAAAIYFGWPIVYSEYILPVQNHTSQIAQLEQDQQQTNAQLAGLATQLASGATQAASQAQTLGGLGSRVDTLESEINAHTQSLTALDEMQTTLQSDKQNLNAELDRQIKVLRGMELLSRARLFLYQSNFGMAKQDVQTARAILAALQPAAPEPLATELTEVVQRLDLCLSRLPDFPVPASDDLDIAWQVLLEGAPLPTALTGTPAPYIINPDTLLTATPTAIYTYTPTTVVDSTPTPYYTATPTAFSTATPYFTPTAQSTATPTP